jgi:hypothetical protein
MVLHGRFTRHQKKRDPVHMRSISDWKCASNDTHQTDPTSRGPKVTSLVARQVRATFSWCSRATWRTSDANVARNKGCYLCTCIERSRGRDGVAGSRRGYLGSKSLKRNVRWGSRLLISNSNFVLRT